MIAKLVQALSPFAAPFRSGLRDEHFLDQQVIECFTRNEVRQLDLRVQDFRLARTVVAATVNIPTILEASETLDGRWALTMSWPDGSESVELVSDHAALLLGYDPDPQQTA